MKKYQVKGASSISPQISETILAENIQEILNMQKRADVPFEVAYAARAAMLGVKGMASEGLSRIKYTTALHLLSDNLEYLIEAERVEVRDGEIYIQEKTLPDSLEELDSTSFVKRLMLLKDGESLDFKIRSTGGGKWAVKRVNMLESSLLIFGEYGCGFQAVADTVDDDAYDNLASNLSDVIGVSRVFVAK